MQSSVDVHEARSLAVGNKAALVEIEHRIGIRRLEPSIEGAQALGEVQHRRHIESPRIEAIAVDRLEQRDPTAWLEHPKKLAKRRRLVGDVDQDRSSRHRVDAVAGDRSEIFGAGFYELTPITQCHVGGQRSAAVEQRLRHIAKDYPPGRTHPLQCTEPDETVTSAHVE